MSLQISNLIQNHNLVELSINEQNKINGGRTLHSNNIQDFYTIDLRKYAAGEIPISSNGNNVSFSYVESGVNVVDTFRVDSSGVVDASQTFNGAPSGALFAWNPGGPYEKAQPQGNDSSLIKA